MSMLDTLETTDPALVRSIHATLHAVGFPDSPTGATGGDWQSATAWAYGFIVDDWPGHATAATVTLWDQVFTCDRTPAQWTAYRAQLERYQAALVAAGYAVAWGDAPYFDTPTLVVGTP